MSLPPVQIGYERAWVSCKKCQRVGYYDYIPYSLSSGVRTLTCGHGNTIRFNDAVNSITEEEGLAAFEKREPQENKP